MTIKNVSLIIFFFIFIFIGLFFAKDNIFSICTDMCSPGETQCIGDSYYQTCEYDARNGCYVWQGLINFCPPNTKCQSEWGYCVPVCISDCYTIGEKRCYEGGGAYQTCQEVEPGCLKWSNTQACPYGGGGCGSGGCASGTRPISSYCSGGECYFNCQYDPSCCIDDCSSGSTQCAGPNSFLTCANYDPDYCLEWSYEPETCPANKICSNGICVPICTDECSIGQRRCSDRLTAQTCGNYDSDSCLEWGDNQSCVPEPPSSVSEHLCRVPLTGAAPSQNVVEDCYRIQTEEQCRAYRSNDFPYRCEWAPTANCGYGSCTGTQIPVWRCDAGYCIYDCIESDLCREDCTNECSPLGLIQCVDNVRKKTCGEYDHSDSCLEWSSPQSCTGDTTCGYASCNDNQRPNWYCSGSGCAYNCVADTSCGSICTDECSPSSQTQCVDNIRKKTCGEYDHSDSCLEWSTPQTCQGDTSCDYSTCLDSQRPSWSCSGGACAYSCITDTSCSVSICTNECPERYQTRCTDNTKEQTCGIYYDTDLCLEWYPPETCTGDTTCGYDTCNDDERPYWYCDTDKCNYSCTQDPTCTPEGYVKEYKQECYDNDLYWFDSNNQIQDKIKDCEDNDSSTRDGCENSQCFNRTQEDDYCFSQAHCPDNICNCDEDVYTCFEDCEFVNLTVTVSAKKSSDKDWKESISSSPKDEIDILITVLNDSSEELDNIMVKIELPQELVYKEKLRIDNISFSGDITQGINIGFLSSNAEKKITFKAQVLAEALIGAETEIVGTVSVEDVSNSDSASITIEKGKTSVFMWLITRWYLWLLLWVLFIIFLYWVLKRSSA